MKNVFFLFIIFVFNISCSSNSAYELKKRISDKNFRYEFYTTTKDKKALKKKEYYWFKGGAIHNSEYGTAGELLDKEFQKFYHTNQLAESGKFKNGLKVGLWKTWYDNGILKETCFWSKGKKKGKYFLYDKDGSLILKGRYKSGKRTGKWINYKNRDTLQYKKDSILKKKDKETLKPIKAQPDNKKEKSKKPRVKVKKNGKVS